MKIVRERLDFNREGDPLQKIGVGKKRPGQPKTFKEVEKFDTAIDYNEEEGEIADTLEITIGPNGLPDEEGQEFMRKYDDTGAMDDHFHFLDYHEGETEELIAVNSPDEGMTYVYTYGPEGAVAVW